MKTLVEMTKDEQSLLLYLETRAVDHRGRVDTRHMNSEDHEKAKEWDASGFIRFGRVASEYLESQLGTHWCRLSDEAWALAAAARKARAARMWVDRTWRTTEEKKAQAA